MKYKKYNYIVIFILMLIIGINNVYAETKTKNCYYASNNEEFKARLVMKWQDKQNGSTANLGTSMSAYADVTIDKIEGNLKSNSEGVINWWHDFNLWPRKECITGKSVCFEFRYKSQLEADYQTTDPNCPNYLVMEDNGTIAVWATDDHSKASSAETQIRKNGYTGYYGRSVSADEYFKEFVASGLVEIDEVTKEPTCTDYGLIFGSADNPESIRYMVNQILWYVRVIVPILIILLGTVDFAKAVLAGKAEEMKKAQSNFIKRLIAGVAVFLVPTLIDIIMQLADIVWAGEYIHCGF